MNKPKFKIGDVVICRTEHLIGSKSDADYEQVVIKKSNKKELGVWVYVVSDGENQYELLLEERLYEI